MLAVVCKRMQRRKRANLKFKLRFPHAFFLIKPKLNLSSCFQVWSNSLPKNRNRHIFAIKCPNYVFHPYQLYMYYMPTQTQIRNKSTFTLFRELFNNSEFCGDLGPQFANEHFAVFFLAFLNLLKTCFFPSSLGATLPFRQVHIAHDNGFYTLDGITFKNGE